MHTMFPLLDTFSLPSDTYYSMVLMVAHVIIPRIGKLAKGASDIIITGLEKLPGLPMLFLNSLSILPLVSRY